MGFQIDPTLDVLGRALGGLAQRESATATNIANVDTPGYQPIAVTFEDALTQASPGGRLALRTTDPRQSPGLHSAISPDASVQTVREGGRNDGNGVDIEAEMTSLTETQIRYSGVARLTTGKLNMLSSVLTKGN